MTTPRGPIVFNNSTGSDTAASGLGPGTAVGGAARAHTGGVSSTTITLNAATDLSGVVAGDIAWLKTASGRQFSVIVSADDGADTFAVDDAFNIPAGSPVDCWIGGKRATLDNADSRNLRTDHKTLWRFEIEYTGTNYTLSSVWAWAGGGGNFEIFGSGSQRPTIEQTANASHFLQHNIFFQSPIYRKLRFINSNGTKTAAIALGMGDGCPVLSCEDCVFGDTTNTLLCAITRTNGSESNGIRLVGCEILKTTGNGIGSSNQNFGLVELHGCNIHDCTGHGVMLGDPAGQIIAVDSIFDTNGDRGLRINGSGPFTIRGCTFYGNTSDGIQLNALSGTGGSLVLDSNIISGNGGYGINGGSGQDNGGLKVFVNRNVFHNNTSGHRNNLSAGPNDQTIDPQFVDAANGDFTPQADLEGDAFPTSLNGIGSFGWPGAIQPEDAGTVQLTGNVTAFSRRVRRFAYAGRR